MKWKAGLIGSALGLVACCYAAYVSFRFHGFYWFDIGYIAVYTFLFLLAAIGALYRYPKVIAISGILASVCTLLGIFTYTKLSLLFIPGSLTILIAGLNYGPRSSFQVMKVLRDERGLFLHEPSPSPAEVVPFRASASRELKHQLAAVATVVAVALALALGLVYYDHLLTPENTGARAEKVVRSLVGPRVKITLVRTIDTPFGCCHEYETDKGAFYVKDDGELVGMYLKETGSSEVKLNEEQARTVAYDFAHRYYLHPELGEMQLVVHRLNQSSSGDNYQFLWCLVQGEVTYPIFVGAKVDAGTGKVVEYSSGYVSKASLPTDPKVSREQAAAIARQYIASLGPEADGLKQLGIKEVRADIWPDQEGHWIFRWHVISEPRTTPGPTGTPTGYVVVVNGVTGQVLSAMGY
ncbi:hypothetical protein [Desulfothermobacter acidiphilus]|uniref:hypothetical protein n=1 Tax=Desulfothermobacter acidiphilus TaxID=1938353 RepID=UPI003F898969